MVTKKEVLEVLINVPAEDFITYRFSDEVSKCCAIGHYSRLTSADPTDYSYTNCSKFSNIPFAVDLAGINNSDPKNIKETVINYLKN